MALRTLRLLLSGAADAALLQFAESEGLASWYRAFVDAPAVAQLPSLRPGQKVLYGQTVGYPAKG
jgi:hypothetical protein